MTLWPPENCFAINIAPPPSCIFLFGDHLILFSVRSILHSVYSVDTVRRWRRSRQRRRRRRKEGREEEGKCLKRRNRTHPLIKRGTVMIEWGYSEEEAEEEEEEEVEEEEGGREEEGKCLKWRNRTG